MFTVRPWRTDDRPAVLALNVELQDYERALRPSRASGASMTETYVAVLEDRLRDPDEDGALFVAEERGRVVGFVTCFVDEDTLESAPDEVTIHDLVVTRAARRRGVGRALVEAVRAFARERGIGRLVVSALKANRETIDAYRALGFLPMTLTLETDAVRPTRSRRRLRSAPYGPTGGASRSPTA